MKTVLKVLKQQKFSVKLKNHTFLFSGAKGGIVTGLPQKSHIKAANQSVFFSRKSDCRLWLAIIKKNIESVITGFMIKLHLQGIGYRAKIYGDTNQLFLKTEGQIFSTYTLPSVVFGKAKKNKIILFSLDKITLYQTVEKIKNMQKPNPYTGKGVRVFGELITLKVGKQRNR